LNVLQAAPPKVTSLYPVGVQRGSKGEITLNGTPGTLPVQTWCSSEQVKITVDESGKTATVEASAEAIPGLVSLRFYNNEGSSELLPFAIGVLSELTEKEPNNAMESELETQLPCLINGTLNKSGDTDTFPVELNEGQTLIASIDANRLFGAPMDAVLQVLSPLGFVIEQNDDDHGTDPLISYKAEESGVHFVRIFAFPATPNSTISYAGGADYVYRLTLTTGPFIHHSIPLENSKNFAVAGWNLPSETMDQQSLNKHPGLHLLQQSVPSTENVELNKPLKLPATRYSTITKPGQRDRHSLNTTKGTTYHINVRARSLGTLLDPVLHVFDKDGKFIKESDDIARDNQDITYQWKAPADGTYHLEVFDRYGFASPFHLYELKVEAEAPAFTLTTSTDHYVVKPGETVEIEVNINRTGGHKTDIVIAAESLPDGITAEPITSPVKGDNAKSVKLKLKATPTAQYQGVLILRGTSSGVQPHSADATAPLKGQLSNSSIWLTVVAAVDK